MIDIFFDADDDDDEEEDPTTLFVLVGRDREQRNNATPFFARDCNCVDRILFVAALAAALVARGCSVAVIDKDDRIIMVDMPAVSLVSLSLAPLD